MRRFGERDKNHILKRGRFGSIIRYFFILFVLLLFSQVYGQNECSIPCVYLDSPSKIVCTLSNPGTQAIISEKEITEPPLTIGDIAALGPSFLDDCASDDTCSTLCSSGTLTFDISSLILPCTIVCKRLGPKIECELFGLANDSLKKVEGFPDLLDALIHELKLFSNPSGNGYCTEYTEDTSALDGANNGEDCIVWEDCETFQSAEECLVDDAIKPICSIECDKGTPASLKQTSENKWDITSDSCPGSDYMLDTDTYCCIEPCQEYSNYVECFGSEEWEISSTGDLADQLADKTCNICPDGYEILDLIQCYDGDDLLNTKEPVPIKWCPENGSGNLDDDCSKGELSQDDIAAGRKCCDGYKKERKDGSYVCLECGTGGVCCGIELNTVVPFIGDCIEFNRASSDPDTTSVGPTTAFPTLMKGLSRLLVTAIMIFSFLLLVVAGVMMTMGGANAGMYDKGKKLIGKVIIGIALLGASGVILRLINPNFFG